MCIELPPYKLAEYPHLGFAWGDIVRPMGCSACGWYGTDAKMHPLDARFECPTCESRSITFYPGIAPDMLQ